MGKTIEFITFKKNKLIYWRTFGLFCVIFAVPFGLLQAANGGDLGIWNIPSWFQEYKGYPSGMEGVLRQLTFFTMWSNIIAMVWVIIALWAEISNKQKLKNIVESSVFKNLVFIMLTVTLIVAFVFLYPLLTYDISSKMQSGEIIHDNSVAWDTFYIMFYLIFLSPLLFQHLLVPIVIIVDYFLTKGYQTKGNVKESGRTSLINMLYASIVPLSWFIISLILIGFGAIEPQYPFMNIYGVGIGREFLNIFIIIIIIALFLLLWWLLYKYTNKKFVIKK